MQSAGGATTDSCSGFVVLSHIRWDAVWLRPREIVARFARHHLVVFVEEPKYDLALNEPARPEIRSVAENIRVFVMHFSPQVSRHAAENAVLAHLAPILDAMQNFGKYIQFLSWCYDPLDIRWLVQGISRYGTVYDCVEELSLAANITDPGSDAGSRIAFGG